MTLEFAVTPQQDNYGDLEIELTDAKGAACLRLILDASGTFAAKAGYRNRTISKYKAGQTLTVKLSLNAATRFYTVVVNGDKASTNLCYVPVESVERIVFRTGSVRHFPDVDTPTDQMYDLPDADRKEKEAAYFIHYVKTIKQD